MLYGKRPFGHELTAKKILLERTILNSKEVEFFNVRPPVSAEAKDFIRRCLSHRQIDRPDVMEILDDPYLRGKPKQPAPPPRFTSYLVDRDPSQLS
jgi:tousled-like kinase